MDNPADPADAPAAPALASDDEAPRDHAHQVDEPTPVDQPADEHAPGATDRPPPPDRQPPPGTVDASDAEELPGEASADEAILEMRQVAGLTAGSVMGLHVGSFQFHESDSEVGFAVVVRDHEEVLIHPGTADTYIDEIELDEPTPLHDAVLNVGTACFTVRPPRPAPSSSARLAELDQIRRRTGAIKVPDLSGGASEPPQTKSTRFGTLFTGEDDEVEPILDGRWWSFLETIRDVRSRAAERHRWLHPDPEELRSRLERLDPGLWDRAPGHPLFGRVALAYATIPWEPRFDAPERIPEALHQPIREMSRLPWVPVTGNLAQGPLGIAGSRAAVLAAARYVLLSLASLCSPSDLTLSIVTAKGLIEDWSWTSALPNSLFPSHREGFLIAVADGMTHFEGAGFEHEAVLRNEMGLIALGESPDDLPEYCGTVLLIAPDGRCTVRNHLGEQVPGTPIGVTSDVAVTIAASIADAVGDQRDQLDRRPAVPPPDRPRPGAAVDDAEAGHRPEIDAGADGQPGPPGNGLSLDLDTDSDTDLDTDSNTDLDTDSDENEASNVDLDTALGADLDTGDLDTGDIDTGDLDTGDIDLDALETAATGQAAAEVGGFEPTAGDGSPVGVDDSDSIRADID